jgi:hypothetical protein
MGMEEFVRAEGKVGPDGGGIMMGDSLYFSKRNVCENANQVVITYF